MDPNRDEQLRRERLEEQKKQERQDKRRQRQDQAVKAAAEVAKVAQPEAAPFIEAAQVAYKQRDNVKKIIAWLIAGFAAIILFFFVSVALIFVIFFGKNASGSCSNLTGSDNPQKAYNFLVSKGLQDFQAAGAIGNLKQESGVDPTAQEDNSKDPEPKNGVGFGIAQWTFTDRQQPLVDLANQKGVPATDLGVQLDYMWQELSTSYKGVLDALKASTTVEDAVNIWAGPNDVHGNPVPVTAEVARSGGYENPGRPIMVNRLQEAQAALAKYGDGAAPGDIDGCNAAVPTGSAGELAKQLLDSPNVLTTGRLVESDLQATVDGQPASAGKPLDEKLLQLLVAMSQKYTFVITALESGGTGHTATSNHYEGLAADIVPSGSTTYDDLNRFIYDNRTTFHIDELIHVPMPDGVTNLKHGQEFNYSQGVLDGHHDHTHVSVEK